MENNPAQQNTTPPVTTQVASSTPQPPSPRPTKKNRGFFSLLGKIFLAIIVIAGLLFGGYYLGKNSRTSQTYSVPSLTQTPTSPTPQSSPTSTVKKTKTVKAGMSTSQYEIEIPDGWTDVRENTQAGVIDKLTLSKNGHTLTIYQAAMGGGGCLYPGDSPTEMSQNFTDFSEIKGTTETFRRSWNLDTAQTISYTICKKGSDGSYGTFSSFGVISAVSPNPANASILNEIDSMIASLKKQ